MWPELHAFAPVKTHVEAPHIRISSDFLEQLVSSSLSCFFFFFLASFLQDFAFEVLVK